MPQTMTIEVHAASALRLLQAGSKQTAFATSVAINRTAKDFQKAETAR